MSAPGGGVTGGVFGPQTLNLGSHKIPYGFVAAGVGVIGLLLVLRARSHGGAVAAIGAPAAPSDGTGGAGAAAAFQPYASIGDLSTGLADLRNAITSGQLQGPAGAVAAGPAPGTAVTAPVAAPSAAAPAPAPAPAALPDSSRYYSVAPGDTLSAIGARFGEDWHTIYAQNQAQIEAAANAHGFAGSGGGHWIFPGQRLKL